MSLKEQQIQEWSRLYDKPISDKEFTEICNNLNGFFTTLKQWSETAEKTRSENEASNNRSLLLPLAP